ncbi:unnamed protein product [Peniophora sp. CBMAI 1063]|nr:unnamed protein product [Peniophora sp. CBMAI 1063]
MNNNNNFAAASSVNDTADQLAQAATHLAQADPQGLQNAAQVPQDAAVAAEQGGPAPPAAVLGVTALDEAIAAFVAEQHDRILAQAYQTALVPVGSATRSLQVAYRRALNAVFYGAFDARQMTVEQTVSAINEAGDQVDIEIDNAHLALDALRQALHEQAPTFFYIGNNGTSAFPAHTPAEVRRRPVVVKRNKDNQGPQDGRGIQGRQEHGGNGEGGAGMGGAAGVA